jgi:crotonobetainyl-CoA:carnitine CoA-transferase CaiB-like acyl-CoA transferase
VSLSERSPRPLDGIRVLELGELIAGPFVGTLLAEFGAEVVKIERPGRGDVLRQFGPAINGSSVFWQVNSRGKKSVVLDISDPKAIAVLRNLIPTCDVVIASMRPGVLEAKGLDEQALKSLNPALVIVYVSAFGRTGPYRDKPGYDPVAQGFSGLSNITGARDGPPMRAGGAIPVCDFMTGVLGAYGVVLALLDRFRRGAIEGQVIDVALYDMAFRMLGPLVTLNDITGRVYERDGNYSLGGAPTGHFRTYDGAWVCVSVQNDEQFSRCAQMIGRPDWLKDQRFNSLSDRTANRELINAEVSRWIADRTRDDVIAAFERADLGIGPINTIADIASDPHLASRGLAFVKDPVFGSCRFPSVVPILSKTPGRVDGPAPILGQDTEQVISEVVSGCR